MITAYDYTQAQIACSAGIDTILVGDSLGQVIQGNATTIPVTIADMCYHTKCVAKGASCFIVSDMPFGSCASEDLAIAGAIQLMQAGAHMVKMEGGSNLVPIIAKLKTIGIPCCAHLGLTPQFVHQMGGYKIQGKKQSDADLLLQNAQLLDDAGADFILLECVPKQVAITICQSVSCPVIAIGCYAITDAQVLVWYDVVGMTKNPPPFSKNFLLKANSIEKAIANYHNAVVNATFPD